MLLSLSIISGKIISGKNLPKNARKKPNTPKRSANLLCRLTGSKKNLKKLSDLTTRVNLVRNLSMASLASLRLAYSVRYASTYLKLRNQRSIMILSANRLLPSMLCRIPLLRIKSMYFTHISACFTASNLIFSQFKLSGHLTDSPGRIIRMQMVNDRFAFQFFL